MVDKITKDEFRLLKSILSKLEEKFDVEIDFRAFYLNVLEVIDERTDDNLNKPYISDKLPGVVIYAASPKYASTIFHICSALEILKWNIEKYEDTEVENILRDTKKDMRKKIKWFIEHSSSNYNVHIVEHSLCSAKTIDEIIENYYDDL